MPALNAPERASVSGNFAMVEGATRADTLEQMRLMQQAAADLGREYEAEYGRNPIDYMIAEIGGNAGIARGVGRQAHRHGEGRKRAVCDAVSFHAGKHGLPGMACKSGKPGGSQE